MDESYPDVNVIPVSVNNLEGLQPTANLGDFGSEIVFNSVLAAMRDRAEEALFLSWEGSKIPKGAQIGDVAIAWSQNGVVSSDRGEIIGTYTRIDEFGGPEQRKQSMIVFPISSELPNA